MNRSDFLNMIEDTHSVNRQMIGEVYELIDMFPYFQSAHMLLLKGLHGSADVKFEKQLKQSSIHIADREVLYYLLQNIPAKKEEAGNTIKPNSEKIISNTQQTVIESARNSDSLIEEIEKNASDALSDESNEQPDPLSHSHSILISNESDYDDSTGVMLVLDEEEPGDEENFFYMDPGFSIPVFDDLLELDLDDSQPRLSDPDNIQPKTSESNSGTANKLLQLELIDKFIISNPRIEPAKDKMSIPQDDISLEFIQEEGGFVTETLAKIYVNQGYYSKAIDIYEKLSLKFPEKSSYFASQIEKVKELIKK